MAVNQAPMPSFATGLPCRREALVKLLVGLLGPVELRAGERYSALGSAKERLALAALSWDIGKAVSTDTLVNRIWDDDLPARPRDSLYTYMSRLRRSLHELGGQGAPVLSGRAQTYVLEAAPETVDLRRYTVLTDRARTLQEDGRSHEALALLEEAGGLWRGEPLAGLPGTWAAQVRAVIGDRHLEAVLLHAEAALRLGRYAEAVAGLSPLAERHADNEALLECFALALYSSGRVEEAARTMQRALRRMTREHGIEPGQRLRWLHEGILNGAPAADLLPPPPDRPTPLQTSAEPVPDNLPSDVVWVGREEELRQLSEGIADLDDRPPGAALVRTIDGMAATGKTALAVHAAHTLCEHFPSAHLFLDLRAHASFQEPLGTAAALTELLRALGHSSDELPRSTAELITLWRTTMAVSRAVIVLDDATGPEQVRPLLPGSSRSLIIVTSRYRLTGLSQARSLSLEAMRLPDAVRLFRERVGAHRKVHEEDVAEVVRLLGRLPLGVEMVASRLQAHPAWTTADLRERFARRVTRLPEIRDAGRELAHVFADSYNTLTERQQLVFRRVGLHLGAEFGTSAAAALAGLPEDETDRVLEELNAHHLISEPVPHRYRLHDLLREFAVGHAEAEGGGQREEAIARLVDLYLHAADQADRRTYPQRLRLPIPGSSSQPSDPPWGRGSPSQWFITEGPNLLATAEYVHRHSTARELAYVAHVLAGYLDAEGYLATAETLLRAAVAYWCETSDSAAEIRARLDLNTVLIHVGDYAAAIETLTKASEIAGAIGDIELKAEALHQISMAHWQTGAYEEAFRYQQECLSIRMSGANRLQQARSLNMAGILLGHLGQYGDSLRYFERALSKYQGTRDITGEYKTLNNIAEVQHALGDTENASRTFRQAIEMSREVGKRMDTATLEMNLAGVLSASGQRTEALGLYEEALVIFRSAGDKRNESITLNGIGEVLQAMDRCEDAIEYHQVALTIAEAIAAANEQAQALRHLGVAEHRTGRLGEADGHLRASLMLAHRMHAAAEEAETRAVLDELGRQRGRLGGSTQ